MRDYLFFPIAGLVLLAMAAAAIAPGPERRREAMAAMGDPETGLLVQGDTLATLQVAEGLSLAMAAGDGEQELAQLAAFRPYDSEPPSPGAFITLPPEFQMAFADKTIRVAVDARQPEGAGSPRFLLQYFSGSGAEPSGWQEAELDGALRTFEFEFTLAPGMEGQTDYIGLWPDPEGQGRSIEITRIAAWPADILPPVSLRPAER